jgi:hypothetical protein
MKIEIEIPARQQETDPIARLSIDGRHLLVMPNGDREPLLIGKTKENNALGDIVADFFHNWAAGLATAEATVRARRPAGTWDALDETTYEAADDALFYA